MTKKLQALLASGAIALAAVLAGCSGSTDAAKDAEKDSTQMQDSAADEKSHDSDHDHSNDPEAAAKEIDIAKLTCSDFVESFKNAAEGKLTAEEEEHTFAKANAVLLQAGVGVSHSIESDPTPEQQDALKNAVVDYCGFDGDTVVNGDLTLDGFTYVPGTN